MAEIREDPKMDTLGVAREAMRALSEREFDRLLELADPGVEWHSFFAGIREGGAYVGLDGMRQYVDDLTEAFDFVHAEVDDGVADRRRGASRRTHPLPRDRQRVRGIDARGMGHEGAGRESGDLSRLPRP
jgi:hypothetical protein